VSGVVLESELAWGAAVAVVQVAARDAGLDAERVPVLGAVPVVAAQDAERVVEPVEV
jgi:hypothetical protein